MRLLWLTWTSVPLPLPPIVPALQDLHSAKQLDYDSSSYDEATTVDLLPAHFPSVDELPRILVKGPKASWTTSDLVTLPVGYHTVKCKMRFKAFSPADMMTKPLRGSAFIRHRARILSILEPP